MKWFNKVYHQLSVEHLWPIIVILGVFSFVNTHPIRPHDFWWHLAIGRDILASGSIPKVDIYSYTRLGETYWSYHQFWLMEIILYLVYRLGGSALTVIVQTLLITPAYFLLLLLGKRLAVNWRAAAFGVLYAAALGYGNWNVRPQAVAFLFVVIYLWGIYSARKQPRRGFLALFPAVMILWVNCHGSFPIGLALIGLWLADECWQILVARLQGRGGIAQPPRRWGLKSPVMAAKPAQSGLPDYELPDYGLNQPLKSGFVSPGGNLFPGWDFQRAIYPAAALALTLLACLANPRGLHFVEYLNTMAGNTVVQNYILEWMPPTFKTLEGSVFLVGLLLITVLLALSPRRPDFFQVTCFLLFGFLGLKYIRGVVWFGIVMAPVVAVHAAALLEKYIPLAAPVAITPRQRRMNWLVVGLMLLLSLVSLPWLKHLLPLTAEKAAIISPETPIRATKFMLEHNLPPQVFHGMGFGSYLVWAAQPEYKVFVDSRIELYPMAIWDEYVILSEGLCNWEELVERYGIHTLMLEPENQAGLIHAARNSPAWEEVYQDEYTVILTRRSP